MTSFDKSQKREDRRTTLGFNTKFRDSPSFGHCCELDLARGVDIEAWILSFSAGEGERQQ